MTFYQDEESFPNKTIRRLFHAIKLFLSPYRHESRVSSFKIVFVGYISRYIYINDRCVCQSIKSSHLKTGNYTTRKLFSKTKIGVTMFIQKRNFGVEEAVGKFWTRRMYWETIWLKFLFCENIDRNRSSNKRGSGE